MRDFPPLPGMSRKEKGTQGKAGKGAIQQVNSMQARRDTSSGSAGVISGD